MGAFCDRMDEELAIRGYSPKTCTSYLGAMRSFVKFARQSPDKLGAEDVRRYQVHLVKQRESSPSTVNVHVSAIRFFYVLIDTITDREHDFVVPAHSEANFRVRAPADRPEASYHSHTAAVRWADDARSRF